MGQSTFPIAAAGGGIKSVQRGVASASGNVTITSVNASKSYVNSFSNASSGSAPSDSSIFAGTPFRIAAGMGGLRDANVTGISGSYSGGTTTLLTAVNGAYLQDATTLVVTGPCYWEVVEMN